MKSLQLSLSVGVLTLALTLSALAGEMGTTLTAPSAGHMDTTAASTNDTSSKVTAVDPVAEIALSLVQSVLALF